MANIIDVIGLTPTFTSVTLSGMTSGSVIFAGTSGLLSQNNTDFFWDNTNHALICSANVTAVANGATTRFHAAGADGSQAIFVVDTFGAAGTFLLQRADNTNASPNALAANENIGVFSWAGYNGTSYTSTRAQVIVTANEIWSTSANGTTMKFNRTRATTTAIGSWLIADDSNPNGGIAGTATVYPTLNTSGNGGRVEFFNSSSGAGSSNNVQSNVRIVGLIGTSNAGNYFVSSTYANPNIFLGPTDSSGNTNNFYSVGAEGTTGANGSIITGQGFYIYDNVNLKTCLTVGYAALTSIQIGANGAPFNLMITGAISQVNNTSTSGSFGVASVMKSARSVAQTAAVASVAAYTVGAADGTFMVSSNVLVTASTTHSFTATCAYTDESNTARVLTLTFSQVNGTILTAITNITGAGAYEGVPLHIRCKASTAITIATAAGGTYTSVTYNVDGLIVQVS